MRVFQKILKSLLCILLALVLIAAAYAAYVFIDYHRIDDNISLDIADDAEGNVKVNTELEVMSYNIGFCAYTPDFSFFMDGGTESRAKSKQSVVDVTNGIISLISSESPDIMLLQEVDEDSDRSHHINERQLITDALSGYDKVFAVNYDSPYLFYPITEPHGKSLSGIITMAKSNIVSSLRRSLPVEDSVMKILDLDRCYTVSRINTDNSKQLVVFNVHLSAYTSDGAVTTKQLEILIDDMVSEYKKGNYVLCGGDFNKDLLQNSDAIFGVSGEEYTWAQPFPENMLKGTSLSLVKPFNENAPVASCRNTDRPLCDDIYRITTDGFIVSDNIEVKKSDTIDLGFEYSDHNPVYLKFVLK